MTQKSIPSIISHRLLFFPRVQKRWVEKKEGEENVGKGWGKGGPFSFLGKRGPLARLSISLASRSRLCQYVYVAIIDSK